MHFTSLKVMSVLVLVTALITSRSNAAPASYIISEIASGTLNGTPFTQSHVDITTSADTNNFMLVSPVVYHVPTSSTSLTIAGLPPTSFQLPTDIVANNNNSAAGISFPQFLIVFASNPAFADYHLDISLGPFGGKFPTFSSGNAFATSGGALIWSSVASATFQATVVPEPLTLTLAAVCIFTMSLAPRRKLPSKS